ncbi:aminopeptidase N [Microbaculum marinisediminis]|uniref:Aminopeptidase N n=1 Tax=Microbaculum marinisediminis TaxID=2931392 RepID=A0AAW5QY16_9HYPH|nr:aminopeptidase N [Microbaculum sp. A6E488]MCT8971180.1 aminopeptidase N [Microbaculum sp. A6E488]
MAKDQTPVVRLQDYAPPAYLVDRVELDFRLDPQSTRVRSRLHVRPNPDGPGGDLVLDGEDLELTALELDGAPLAGTAYKLDKDRLTITTPPERAFVLDIGTTIDPSANTRLMGLYRSNGVYCTQCEAEGFRRITFFPDRPDVLAVYTVRIEARASDAPVLLSNGNPVGSGVVAGSDRHYAVWHDPHPKPSYLFALVGGDLGRVGDTFVTASGREVTLGIYVEKGKEDRCDYALEALKRSMRWDEDAFGREYDLDVFNIVAVSDFNMGAMENKGLNVFNDKYVLASPETATDTDYANIEAIIAHEYFHNWTGNRITCRDWFQLCLKEGLTVFRDQEFSADVRSRAVERIGDVRTLKAHQFVEDAGPLAHPVRPETYKEINNFYTATVYEKGAELIRMLKTLLGADGFRAGMDLYFDRHDGTAATIEDFIGCFAEATGRKLDDFMLWYHQAGTPEVTASGRYDTAARTYELTLEQTCPPTPGQPTKQPMPIPIAFALLGPDGDEITDLKTESPAVRDGLIELTGTRERIVFTDLPAKPVPSLLRGFSAPVKLTANLTDDDLLFAAAEDSDPYNRWQAVQSLATRILIAAQAAIADGRTPEIEPRFLRSLEHTVEADALDPSFRAQVLSLPSESDIAREIGRNVDPDAIHGADQWLRGLIGGELGACLTDVYRRFGSNLPYSPDAAGAGRRALRNTALGLIAGTGQAGIETAEQHYRNADNMTDRMAGLSALTRQGAPEADAALDDFFERYRTDPLVLDKWFSLQATMTGADTLDRVTALMRHPAFSLSNPNRVRALVGAFAAANPTQFNRADGAGYRLVADFTLEIDRSNPQVAARLLSAFRSWRVLEPVRRAAAEAALRRIAGHEGLSRDSADIVERSLD